MNAHTVLITIGRNVDDQPLPSARWARFQLAVCDAATLTGEATLIGDAATIGEWEGVSEDAYWSLWSVPAVKVSALRAELSTIGASYQQDAIGFVAAPSDDRYDRPGTLITCQDPDNLSPATDGR